MTGYIRVNHLLSGPAISTNFFAQESTGIWGRPKKSRPPPVAAVSKHKVKARWIFPRVKGRCWVTRKCTHVANLPTFCWLLWSIHMWDRPWARPKPWYLQRFDAVGWPARSSTTIDIPDPTTTTTTTPTTTTTTTTTTITTATSSISNTTTYYFYYYYYHYYYYYYYYYYYHYYYYYYYYFYCYC